MSPSIEKKQGAIAYLSIAAFSLCCLCLSSCATFRQQDTAYRDVHIRTQGVLLANEKVGEMHSMSAMSQARAKREGDQILRLPAEPETQVSGQIAFDGNRLALKQFVPSDDRAVKKQNFMASVFSPEKSNPVNYCPEWIEGSLFPYLQVQSPNMMPAWHYLYDHLSSQQWQAFFLSEKESTIRFLMRPKHKSDHSVHFFMERKGDSFYMSYSDQDDPTQGRLLLKRIYALLKARCQ